MDIKKNTAVPGFPFVLIDATDYQGVTTWPTRGHVHLVYSECPTGEIPWNATTIDVQIALQALLVVGVGPKLVCSGGPLPHSPIQVEFIGTLGLLPHSIMSVVNELRGGVGAKVSVSRVQLGQSQLDRVDELTGHEGVVTGVFSLSVTVGEDTQSVGNLSCSIQPYALQQQLESLSNVGAGNVHVNAPAGLLDCGGTFTIQWVSALHGLNGPSDVSIDAGDLGYTISQASAPTPGQNEIQRIEMTTEAVSGYYVLDGGTQTALDGPFADKGYGQWTVDLPAAATNGDLVGLLFVAPGVIPAHFTLRTIGYDPAAPGMVVGGYASGQSPADLVLAQPEHKLVTDLQGRVAVGAVDDAERNALADALLARDIVDVEATAAEHSLCYVVLALSQADRTAHPGKLTVYHRDGVTPFCQKTITTSPDASPITKVQ
jgi:hypothetical protein